MKTRDALDEVQRSLRATPGVTVLVYEQTCAAELRRDRRRGLAPEPKHRVVINERVCEGCGDCGAKSNCLSVHPVDTAFGPKTTIHQASCNKDFSCLDGECPAFVEVEPSGAPERQVEVHARAPEPSPVVGPDVSIVMTGIGGTGVVTCNQILATAALLDGKHASALDQTGLSQKGGPVTSSLKISAHPFDGPSKVAEGGADVLLAFDVLAAADEKNLVRADPSRTRAVVSTTRVPTGAMVSNRDAPRPDFEALRGRIAAAVAGVALEFDAERIALDRFGSHLPANMIVVGAAFQLGLVPLGVAAIGRAIELNGVSTETMRAAFEQGRALAAVPADPAAKGTRPTPAPAPEVGLDVSDALAARVAFLRDELATYQGPRLARRFTDRLAEVRAAERSIWEDARLTAAAAEGYYKLLAYKDEYEVARLLLDPAFKRDLQQEFGSRAKVRYLLRPPILHELGLQRKLSLGRWFRPALVLLRALRHLRGTPSIRSATHGSASSSAPSSPTTSVTSTQSSARCRPPT